MKREVYTEVVRTIETSEWDFDACVNHLIEKFPDVGAKTLRSILSQQHQRRVKRSYALNTSESKRAQIIRQYKEGVARGDPPGVIVEIAKKNRFSPGLTGRILIEDYYSRNRVEGEAAPTNPKPIISKLLRNPNLITDPRLGCEVENAIYNDSLYGPMAESIKQGVGHEYEVLLKQELRKRDIGFEDEKEFRAKGYDKTPDVKLVVPFSVNGIIINWIESKALFGDDEHHTTYLRDQLWSYWNRFGPGMVIYWFGFIDDLNTKKHKGILVSDHFPQNLSLMKPKFDWSCVADRINLTLETSTLLEEDKKEEDKKSKSDKKDTEKENSSPNASVVVPEPPQELERPDRFEA